MCCCVMLLLLIIYIYIYTCACIVVFVIMRTNVGSIYKGWFSQTYRVKKLFQSFNDIGIVIKTSMLFSKHSLYELNWQ